MKSICVFCGARPGARPEFLKLARRVGEKIAESGFRLIYGGGKVGLMGAVAEGALSRKGEVIGVIPGGLFEKEIGFSEVTELIVVKSMHERKAKMESLSDAFLTLPGGFGTMDELNEIITWAQIGIHNKPVHILNFQNFFDDYLKFLDKATQEGFISPSQRSSLGVSTDEDEALKILRESIEF